MKDFKKIKLLILDCDGVLTDGKIIYNNDRLESKNFSAKDGLGIKLLSFTDIKVAIITGRESELVKQRCEDLGIEILHQKIRNKLVKTQEVLDELKLDWDNVAYMGDDWNDYPVMKRVYFSGTPSDAFSGIQEKVDFVSNRKGGEGAVRDFIEHILRRQGTYEKVIEDFVNYLESR